MRKVFAFLLLIFCFMPWVSIADEQNDNIDANSNMNYILSKIKDNNVVFDNLVEEMKKKYKKFDWNGFEDLSEDTKRIVVQNFLASEAFSEVEDSFKKDIYTRTQNNVTVEDFPHDTYYYNSSDGLYRKNYVEDNIMAEAKRQNLLHPTEGTNWYHFKQQDLPALDKIIASEIAKSPADMYCDKECIKPRSSVDQDWAKTYLANWKKELDEYEKERIESFKQVDESLEKINISLKEYEQKYSENKSLRDQFSNLKQRHEDSKQDFANKMMQKRKEYDEAVARSQKIDVWEMNPYNENCEMVSISCWNVEHIPEKYERFRLSITKYDEDKADSHSSVMYSYDDLDSKEHVEATAMKSCDCYNKNKDNRKSVNCSCFISFYDMTTDFDKYRRYENLDRIDIKNGKLQDRNEKGVYQHDWAGNHMPVGHISSRTLDLFGRHTLTTNKDE